VQQSCCDRAEDGYLLEIQASSLTAALLLLDIFLEILVITFVLTTVVHTDRLLLSRCEFRLLVRRSLKQQPKIGVCSTSLRILFLNAATI
jgi:hypothetical protein